MLSRRTTVVVGLGLVVSLLLSGILSSFASGAPDGLTKVASEQGFADTEQAHGLSESPLAGYETRGVEQGPLAGGLAGVAGVGVTFLVAAGVVAAVRRRPRQPARDDQR